LNKGGFKDILITFLGFGVSAVLLTVIQVPFDFGFLAWGSLVPFILICSPKRNTWRLIWISYIVSVCYWLGNLYWIAIVTVPAYIAFCFYLGLYWPVMALCVQYFRRKNVVLFFLAVAFLFIGAEAWQGILVTGFSWRLLGHSQYENLRLIQIADLFGVLGISFVIAMVNGLIAELIMKKRSGRVFQPVNIIKLSAVCLVLAAVIFYGHRRIRQTDEYIEEGPLVGSVQPNVPSAVKELTEAGDEILTDLIDRSRACMDAGAQLVAWPETMVLSTLNLSFLVHCKPESEPLRFHHRISRHVKGNGYVLAGAPGARVDISGMEPEISDRYNSAVLYRPDGAQDPRRYDKIHLIPFGEYIPFKNALPFFYNLILKMSPYDYDYNLTPGREYTAFDIVSDGKVYRFGVLICYEDTDPRVTRKMVVSENGSKRIDWLVNISNDGWYVRFKDDRVLPSTELSQRTAISVFRAVENRISIIRSVNTGISCLIDSTGRIKDGFVSGNLPQIAMARQGVAGWFVDRIRTDKRVTFFSRHGGWVEILAAVSLVVIIMLMFLHSIGRFKNK